MKKILMGLLILSGTTLFAQNNRDNHDRYQRREDRGRQAPDNVQRSFKQEYPNAQNTQWINTNGQWHSTYKDQNNRSAESYYNRNGQRVDTHYNYNSQDLPAGVRERANKRYQSNYNAYRIERPNAQPVYQVRTRDGRVEYMDENGNKRKYKDRH